MSFSSGKNLSNNINLTEAQTLQNKTIDNTNAIDGASIDNSTITGASLVSPTRADVKKDTQANLETYAATATEGQLVYATDTKTMYQIKNNALSEVSGGAGGINYIENSDFEINLDGYTDDVNLTLARTTLANEILRGSASGKISKAAVDASGEEISIPFTVDRAGLASKITVSLEVDASDPNYADGDLRIAVRKDPNGTPSIIRVNGEDIKGGKGTVYAQFQTDAVIDEYELLIQCNSTNASAYDVIIDDVKVGPTNIAFGNIVTDFKTYTPTFTGFGTVSTEEFEYKRVGDSMFIQGKFTVGSATATEAQISLPNSLTVRSDVTLRKAGTYFRGSTSTSEHGTILITGGDSFFNFSEVNDSSDKTVEGTGSSVSGSGQIIILNAHIPIEGWSNTAAISEDLGGREVVVRAEGNSGASVTANTEKIDFTIVEDTTASFSTVDNGPDTFTVPETGYYQIDGQIAASGATAALPLLFKNGSQFRVSGDGDNSASRRPFHFVEYLQKGDVIDIRSNSTITISNSANSHFIHIQKLASPQTILETETVAARYTSNSGQSIPNSTDTVVVYEDLTFDTHNAYNTSTGVYTVPVSGYYDIKALATFSLTAANSSQILQIEVDGVIVKGDRDINDAAGASYAVSVQDLYYLNKGQTVEISTFQNSGASRSLVSASESNTFSIHRIK